MEYRYLGRSGLKVSALSLGGWITYGGQVGDETAYKCIRTAFELGINFFDTAEVYGAGQSEIDMGKAFKRLQCRRSELVVSTKLFWGGKSPNERGLSRKHIVEGLNQSLERLNMDYVDIVFAHRPDPETPMEEIVRAFNFLIEQGKAFYWGTSEWSSQQITEAHLVAEKRGLIGPLCEQPQYNMFHRERVEKEYIPLFSNYGLGTTIWSPLASGVLTGKYNDPTRIPVGSRLSISGNTLLERMRMNLATEEGQLRIRKVKQLGEVATGLGVTCAQLALAWCLKNPHVSSVITGASSAVQVAENVASLEVVPKLTPTIMCEIDRILGNKPEEDMNFRGM